MKTEVKPTADGSNTLFVPELNEHYHSVHGALQEALYVFINCGLVYKLQGQSSLRVLEVGFGTGLNAILSLQHFLTAEATVYYETIEKYPLSRHTIDSLKFGSFILNPELLDNFYRMHAAEWNRSLTFLPGFTLKKTEADLETVTYPDESFDLVYFDAFAPEKQPHLWADAIFLKMASLLKPGGILVSYCAKGSFKRSLKAAGLRVETLPGPPGKREMVRAHKEKNKRPAD